MTQTAPRTWLVVGEKLGDNAQVRVIADALDWPSEWKILRFKPPFEEGKPPIRPSLEHVDLARSDALAPPWPDLIITIGRRPLSAALWIKRQSGGRCKLVLLGRPKDGWEPFDLIIAASHYPLPPDPRVLALRFPLIYPDREKIAAGRARWAELAALPKPLIPVLVGGQTRPYRFGAAEAEMLIEHSRRLAGSGTAFFCTSRRTKPPVREAIRRSGLPYYDWHEGGDNPYFGLLAHGDAFVVSGDSISMMMEVARLRKPLAIFPLPQRGFPWLRRLKARLAGHGRCLERIHEQLYASGAAVPLGEGNPFSLNPAPLEDELETVIARIRQLFANRESFVLSS